jgi:O-antigen ligase
LAEREWLCTLIWGLAGYAVIDWVVALIDPSIGFWDVGSGRLQGISGHPNMLGQQMGTFLCLLIAGRLYLGPKWFFGLLAFGIGTLLMTASRTSAMAVMISLCAYYYRRSFLLVALLLLVMSVFLILTGYFDNVTGLLVRDDNADALAGRGDIWEYLDLKVSQGPWLGYGFNTFEPNFEMDNPNVLNPTYPLVVAAPSHPHNNFLEVLFNGGIVTLVPYVMWNCLMLWRWFRRPEKIRDLFVLFVLAGSFTEVSIAGTPYLGSLTLFTLLPNNIRKRYTLERA